MSLLTSSPSGEVKRQLRSYLIIGYQRYRPVADTTSLHAPVER